MLKVFGPKSDKFFKEETWQKKCTKHWFETNSEIKVVKMKIKKKQAKITIWYSFSFG